MVFDMLPILYADALGFSCSNSVNDTDILRQGDVERILDALHDKYEIPITNVSVIQLAERSNANNVKLMHDGSINYRNTIHLPHLSTRLIEFIHSRSINTMIELDTADSYMALYDMELKYYQQQLILQNRMIEVNKHKVKKLGDQLPVSINPESDLFNMNNEYKKLCWKYQKHPFLILVKTYLQLGTLVVFPYSSLSTVTNVIKVVTLEMPPVTPSNNNLLMNIDVNNYNLLDRQEMENITYDKLFGSILHPFVYRKEFASATRILKFILSSEDLDGLIQMSTTLEAKEDEDEYYVSLGTTKPPARLLKY